MDEQTLRSLSASSSRPANKPGAFAGAQVKQKAATLGYPGDIQHPRQQQQQQQYHDNNNGNNNAKVKLLITPATESYGSRQQMDRSATITTAINSQQQRSQQNNRQKNYHHYDYYTDSDLTSSLLATTTTTTTTTTQANINNYYYDNYNSSDGSNNYDQNILLFATEHNQHSQRFAANGNQQAQATRLDKLQRQQQQQQQQHLPRQHLANSQLLDPVANRTLAGRAPLSSSVGQQTGKFINHYPSWRQTQSPTASHYQNYSFHVPLHQQQHQSAASRHHYGNYYRPQSRFGFVSPGERTKLSHRTSFKSRTLAHLPQAVHLQQQAGSRRRPDVVGQGPEEPEEAEEEEEEINYYDRPTLETRQFMLSEGDLLKVRSVVLEDGPENPFRPGTELSWEAEMMVRLMKRGYPVQELPALVEAAKQVAATAGAGGSQPRPSRSREAHFQRRQSSHDLSGTVKQVWASSLSRAKSVPRFSANAGDVDSLDMLITSIENELGQPEVEQSLPTGSVEVSQGQQEDTGQLPASSSKQQTRTAKRRSSGSMRPSEASVQEMSANKGVAGAKQKTSKQQRTSSEQQVSADNRHSNRKSSSARTVATKPNGKYNQMVDRDGNKKSDLREANTQEVAKKRITECCIIQ